MQKLFNISIRTALDGKILVVGLWWSLRRGSYNVISKSNRFWLYIGLCAGSIKTKATCKVSAVVHCAGQINIEKQALQQPQLGAGQVLETNAKTVAGTAMIENPGKNAIRRF